MAVFLGQLHNFSNRFLRNRQLKRGLGIHPSRHVHRREDGGVARNRNISKLNKRLTVHSFSVMGKSKTCSKASCVMNVCGWISEMSVKSQMTLASDVRRICASCSAVKAEGAKKFSYQNRSPRRVYKTSFPSYFWATLPCRIDSLLCKLESVPRRRLSLASRP